LEHPFKPGGAMEERGFKGKEGRGGPNKGSKKNIRGIDVWVTFLVRTYLLFQKRVRGRTRETNRRKGIRGGEGKLGERKG